VARLLQLMVHSVYSDRDVFVRELISNAADACEKLRFEALSNPKLAEAAADPNVTIIIDKDGSTLTFADNGVGMSRQDLVDALGTIANSGTRAFLEQIQDSGPGSANLIGQFGIGFYSAFMVAESVDVVSRRAGAAEAWKWSSRGEGEYTLQPVTDADLATGTRVILHMRPDASGFLEPFRLEQIVRQYSSAIATPVRLADTPDAEPRTIATGAAIWTRPKSEITADEYRDFYREITRQSDEPALTVHWRAEGRNEYTVVAFVPGSPPVDLFDPARKGRARLFVRRVLITDDADLLPGWLRFVRVVVDSADLPLNVSREMIQNSPAYSAIRAAVTNRIVQELVSLSTKQPETFASIWKNFGAVLKEGLYEDPSRQDQLFEIARFRTTTSGDGERTLAEYVKDMRPNQTSIYFIAGDDAKRIASSPQIEGFRSRGVEVLLLSDPVDSFWVSSATGYDGKPFKSATRGSADIGAIPLLDSTDSAEREENGPEVATLTAYARQLLESHVEDVRITDRLTASPACLVAPDQALDRRLEQILAAHGHLEKTTKPVLELNPKHALIATLARKLRTDDDRAFLDDALWLIFDEARMADGERPVDGDAFSHRLFNLLTHALG